jgi:alpha-ketoglutarate-dependent taurine dioxygenase
MTSATTPTAAPRVDLDVTLLSGTIGAVINDVDVRTIDDATVDVIRRVWLERKVIFFRNQHLDPHEHVAFASRFGEPTEGHPVIRGLKDEPHGCTRATAMSAGPIVASTGTRT